VKKAGYSLMQIAAWLIIAGGLSDVLMPLFTPSLPEAHLHYLNIATNTISIQLRNLDAALIRAIGGCLIGIGVGALTIIYAVLKSNKSALIGLLAMVTIGEGINTSQMLQVDSPYFTFPLICVIIIWIGGVLWWFGNKRELK
jgi:hypothetical protein